MPSNFLGNRHRLKLWIFFKQWKRGGHLLPSQDRFDLQGIHHRLPKEVVVGDHIAFPRLLGDFLNPGNPRIQFVERVKVVVAIIPRGLLAKPICVIPPV